MWCGHDVKKSPRSLSEVCGGMEIGLMGDKAGDSYGHDGCTSRVCLSGVPRWWSSGHVLPRTCTEVHNTEVRNTEYGLLTSFGMFQSKGGGLLICLSSLDSFLLRFVDFCTEVAVLVSDTRGKQP